MKASGDKNSNLILSTLKSWIDNPEDSSLNFKVLRKEAAERFKPDTQELTEEAIAEAKDHFFDPARYKNILTSLKNSQSPLLIKSIITQYKAGIIDIDKSFKEKSITNLVSLYSSHKNHIDLERLLLLNPGSEESKTTFVHELFSHSAPKAVIINFFKELDKLSQLNPELMRNYLDLSDINGKSIRQLVEDKSLTEKYLGIATEIKAACKSLYPNANQNNSLVIDTHTGSVHGSVDHSLAKLALVYEPKLITVINNGREVKVDRTDKWNKKVQTNLNELDKKLNEIIASDQSIDEFIKPTLAKGENQEEARNKFKFHANTALRLIEGLNKGGYGNHYYVHANEKVSCGLTPKEVVAIGYASLENRDLWNNEDQKTQQLMQFVEHLYVAKRGYNIDKYGDKEWATHSSEVDENKCTGGSINEITYGLTDHSLVEIKVITPETMAPILSKGLANILEKLAASEESTALISNWLANGTLNSNLSNQIIEQLQKDPEFSQEFSQNEISSIGLQVLNKFNREDLSRIKNDLQTALPDKFSKNTNSSENLLNKEQVYSFAFNPDQGYVPYLESLFSIDKDRFKAALKAKLSSDLSKNNLDDNNTRKINVMLSLLLASQNQELATATTEIFQTHLNESNFTQAEKDQYLILAAEHRLLHLLEPLKNAGANVDARDSRTGHFGVTALCYAAENGLSDAINKLLKLGADVNAKDIYGHTALHHAACRGRTEVLEKLIEAKADINAKDNNGKTALHRAVDNSSTEALAKLIRAKADINVKDNIGQTALHLAAWKNSTEALAKLIEAKADINAKNKYGTTALHIAAENGRTEVLEKLIEAKADINATNIHGQTALLIAVEFRSTKALAKLIEAKADINAKDQYGQTALHLATEHGIAEVIEELIELGANVPLAISALIKQGSGYIENYDRSWKAVDNIIKLTPDNKRIEIVSETLKEIDNASVRDKLLSFLKPNERGIASANMAQTTLQEISHVTELMHGNSSVNVPATDQQHNSSNKQNNGKGLG